MSPAGERQRTTSERKRFTARGLGLSVLGVVGLFLGQLAWQSTTAFHGVDVLLAIMVGLALLEGAGMALLCFGRPDLATRFKAAKLSTLGQAVVLAVMLGLLAPAILLVWLNQALDPSPGKPQTPTVREKWITTRKNGLKICKVGVTIGVRRSPFLFTSFYGDIEPIRLPCSSYAAIQPGRSKLRLAVHPGAFGLPWYGNVSLGP